MLPIQRKNESTNSESLWFKVQQNTKHLKCLSEKAKWILKNFKTQRPTIILYHATTATKASVNIDCTEWVIDKNETHLQNVCLTIIIVIIAHWITSYIFTVYGLLYCTVKCKKIIKMNYKEILFVIIFNLP